MTLKELVCKHNKVEFLFYRKGELWYEVLAPAEITIEGMEVPGLTPLLLPVFRFPVPISDCGEGTFKAEDRAITFMRYIRQQLDEEKKENQLVATD